jgi:hypothetical protein
MMEEARTCETSFSVYKNTRRNISQNNRLHICRRENLTSVTISVNLIKSTDPWGGQIQLGNYDFLVKEFSNINQGKWDGRGMWYAWERTEKCTEVRWKIPKERDHSEDRGVDGRTGSEWVLLLERLHGGCSGFSWLRTGTGGRLL